jgi:two-component system phosphate regulon response regulator OmpR
MTVHPRTVLVVDDEAGLRRVLERHLTREGYRVVAAGTAESAYEQLVLDQPDALLLDIHLPTMSGLALYIAIVRRWPRLEGRVAIMTGDADADEVRTWLEYHSCPVIRKPFNLAEITTWLETTLRWRDRETGNA